jgi:hypothetical protein
MVTCIDSQTDELNCGGCGVAVCDLTMGETCVAGRCTPHDAGRDAASSGDASASDAGHDATTTMDAASAADMGSDTGSDAGTDMSNDAYCTPLRSVCHSSTECCQGTCGASGGCCLPTTSTGCSSVYDCCWIPGANPGDQDCNAGTCCQVAFSQCSQQSDCCDLPCTTLPPQWGGLPHCCLPFGAACGGATAGDCCVRAGGGGGCNGGVCCLVVGAQCSGNDQCCSGFCDVGGSGFCM